MRYSERGHLNDQTCRRVFNIIVACCCVLALGLFADWAASTPFDPGVAEWVRERFSWWWVLVVIWAFSLLGTAYLYCVAPRIEDMDDE